MSYTDVHRLFLQVMMSHCFLTRRDTLKKYRRVCVAVNDSDDENLSIDDLQKVIHEINQKIKSLNMEIRKGINETSSEEYHVLVNTVAVPLNLTLKTYSVSELEVFKKIVEEIVDSPNGVASSISCMNLNITGMSKTDIEASIQKFIRDKWLTADLGIYALSVRTITEMGPYLKSIYKDDISSCELCKEIIFQGFRCNECDTMIHLHCLKIYSNQPRSSDKGLECPNSDCTEIILDDPHVDTDRHAAQTGGRDSSRGSVSRTRTNTSHSQDSEVNESAQMDVDDEPQLKRKKERNHRH